MAFYRLLLWLYPASFRNEYRDELVRAFASRAIGASGATGRLRVALAAIGDVVPSAFAVHWDLLRQDLRHTARSLRRSPGFALTAIVVVALGAGANTAAFSLADFVLIKPLPYADPDRLVNVWETTPGYPQMEASPGNYRDWKAMATSFSAMGAFTGTEMNLIGAGEPRRVSVGLVTADLLPVLGVRPLLGHFITETDGPIDRAMMLTYGLWQSAFAGDPGIVGRTLILDGIPRTVVGIMPPDFSYPSRGTQLWLGLPFTEEHYRDRADNMLNVLARLRGGVAIEDARKEMSRIALELERRFPKENEKTGSALFGIREEMSDRSRMLLFGLCGAALCILLLACANLANLLLARAISREREIAVRSALGAGRERLVRQLLTESAVLGLIGGAVGILVAVVGLPLLTRVVPDTLPVGTQPGINATVLVLAALVMAATVVAFGVFPAFRAGRSGSSAASALRNGPRAGGGRRQRVRGLLVMIEVMASVVLLVASGLLVRAMLKLQSVEPGFRTDGVLTARTALPMPEYAGVVRRARFYDQVLGEVRALPGVTSAAYISGAPLVMRGGVWPVTLQGAAVLRDAGNSAMMRFVTPQYFRTLDIPLLRGRDIVETDDIQHPLVAVISASVARRIWPNDDPIGKRFTFALSERMVIGVVGDIRGRGLERASEPQVYLPYKQVEDNWFRYYAPKDLIVQSTVTADMLLPAIRRIVHAADPNQPVSDVRTMGEIVARETASRRAQLYVLGVLTAVALLLAGIGIHGVLSFMVASRTREIGVRRALGAQPSGIVAMVLRDGVLMALAGIVPGVAIAYAAGRGMEALLAGVRPGDPVTIGIAVLLCATTTIVGCIRPTLNALKVDPVEAMRVE